MKSFFHKIVSITMALVVLLSTFSFTVGEHYCGDILVDFSFFGKAQSCGMEIQQAQDSHEHNFEKIDCCNDVTLLISGQHDLKISLDKLSFDQQVLVATFVYSYINLIEGLDENLVPFNHYPPPLLVKDIHILDQTFLI